MIQMKKVLILYTITAALFTMSTNASAREVAFQGCAGLYIEAANARDLTYGHLAEDRCSEEGNDCYTTKHQDERATAYFSLRGLAAEIYKGVLRGECVDENVSKDDISKLQSLNAQYFLSLDYFEGATPVMENLRVLETELRLVTEKALK